MNSVSNARMYRPIWKLKELFRWDIPFYVVSGRSKKKRIRERILLVCEHFWRWPMDFSFNLLSIVHLRSRQRSDVTEWSRYREEANEPKNHGNPCILCVILCTHMQVASYFRIYSKYKDRNFLFQISFVTTFWNFCSWETFFRIQLRARLAAQFM